MPVIASHDHQKVEVAIFANVAQEDAVTETYRSMAEHWFDLRGRNDAEIAEMVRTAGIDILVDIAGHSIGNSLGAFALKPAPVQVTAWGFPTGTGMRQIDWVLVDKLMIRPEEQRDLAEGVWYLPNWAGYAPPDFDLDPGPLPALAAGRVTFGSFGRTEKISGRAIDLWCRILARVPTARLVVKASNIRDDARAAVVRQMFASRGVDPSRLDILGPSSKEEQLRVHRRVDIALDAFPQVGGITTFEALWMGVPVVTLYGHVQSSRGAASILSAVGLNELIAESEEHYFNLAVALAEDWAKLERLRSECRTRLTTSPAGNPKLYVAAVEDAYRAMWRRWCATRGG